VLQLLLNFTNGGIIDSTNNVLLETFGNARISTAKSKWGNSSMYFDGNEDHATVTPSNDFFKFKTDNFTVECWVNPTVVAQKGVFQLSDSYSGGTTGGGLKDSATNSVAFAFTSTNKASIYANNTQYISTGVTIAVDTWTHIAIVRASGVTKLYINGSLDTTIGTSGSITDATNYTCVYLAVGGYYSTTFLLNGYLADLRVTKAARYLNNFTPPTSQFQDQ